MNFFILKQIAALPPESFSQSDRAFIVPRVARLTSCSRELAPWIADLGVRVVPAVASEERAAVRAELDAYMARLYGLTREELTFVLDPQSVRGADYPTETFRVLKNGEIARYGEYRTGRLVLEAWDRLVGTR